MVCPNCGSDMSVSESFCKICGARIEKSEGKKTEKTSLPRRETVIDGSFISGTVFAILGFVLYIIFLGGVMDETETSVSHMFESFLGFSNETVSWIYIALLFVPMVLLPIGFVMFVTGADNGKPSGVGVISVGVIVQILCTLISFISTCIDFLPNIGAFFDRVSLQLELAQNASQTYGVIGSAFFELFFSLIHPLVFILWFVGVLHGVHAISKKIKFGGVNPRPSAPAIYGGSTLGVLRILMVVFLISMVIIGQSESGRSVDLDMNFDGIVMLLGYICISVAMISFSTYLGHAAEYEFCKSDEALEDSVYVPAVEIPEVEAVIPVATVTESPAGETPRKLTGTCPVCGRRLYDYESCDCAKYVDMLKTGKFCIYCMKPLPKGGACDCEEAMANMKSEVDKAAGAAEPENAGGSRVSINLKHRPAPGSPEAKKAAEGAKMFSAPGDL
ncbi:MAG: hypothetical protein E7473_07460 [Ruminococcaceae bacterium]|nr:hypothetical protein [Oscillospiraceae bacterium]